MRTETLLDSASHPMRGAELKGLERQLCASPALISPRARGRTEGGREVELVGPRRSHSVHGAELKEHHQRRRAERRESCLAPPGVAETAFRPLFFRLVGPVRLAAMSSVMFCLRCRAGSQDHRFANGPAWYSNRFPNLTALLPR